MLNNGIFIKKFLYKEGMYFEIEIFFKWLREYEVVVYFEYGSLFICM